VSCSLALTGAEIKGLAPEQTAGVGAGTTWSRRPTPIRRGTSHEPGRVGRIEVSEYDRDVFCSIRAVLDESIDPPPTRYGHRTARRRSRSKHGRSGPTAPGSSGVMSRTPSRKMAPRQWAPSSESSTRPPASGIQSRRAALRSRCTRAIATARASSRIGSSSVRRPSPVPRLGAARLSRRAGRVPRRDAGNSTVPNSTPGILRCRIVSRTVSATYASSSSSVRAITTPDPRCS